MAKIVITPGKTIAFAIAVAFDGIYTKDGHIDSDTLNQDIPKHADKIKGFFIKTKINGEDAFILWQKNTELVKFNQPPRLKTYQLPYLSEVKYSISKAWENAIDKVLKENPYVDTIVLALIPTMRASYFAHLLPEKYTDIKYTSVSLTKISKGYIRRAFENERMLDTAQTRAEYESDACRKRITDLVRVNMSAAMQPFMKRYVQVDQYILTALFMIRTRIRLKGRKRHRIQIVVKAGDASVRAESTMTFSEEDAKKPLEQDTYYFVEADQNYIMKHAGDLPLEGGKEITKEEFVKGSAEIATGKKRTRRRKERN